MTDQNLSGLANLSLSPSFPDAKAQIHSIGRMRWTSLQWADFNDNLYTCKKMHNIHTKYIQPTAYSLSIRPQRCFPGVQGWQRALECVCVLLLMSPSYSSQNHLPLKLGHLQNNYDKVTNNYFEDLAINCLTNPRQTSFAPTKMVINFQSFFISKVCECCIILYKNHHMQSCFNLTWLTNFSSSMRYLNSCETRFGIIAPLWAALKTSLEGSYCSGGQTTS